MPGPKSDKIWADAIKRAVHRQAKDDQGKKAKRLDILADQVVKAAIGGDMTAAKEVGDRLDGKPSQSVGVGAADNLEPLEGLTINFVSPD